MTAKATALWSTLHDGWLERIESASEGQISLTFDSPHVREHAGLPTTARFVARLEGELSLVAAVFEPAPRPAPVESSGDPAAYRAAVEAWRAAMLAAAEASETRPMKSWNWDDFVARLAAAENKLEIRRAELGPRPHREDGSALWLCGELATYLNELWIDVTVSAQSIHFARETGEAIDLEALVRLGDAYWNDRNRGARPSS